MEIAVSTQDSREIECQVDADPCELEFTWFLRNRYGDFTMNFTSRSIVYHIETKEDYGIMCCQGTNVIGIQRTPCCMLISPEDPPRIPRGCNFTLTSNSSFSVACQNESLRIGRQRFHLEVFDLESKRMQANITLDSSPVFHVEKINPSSSSPLVLLLLLYTSNGRGRSASINLTVDFSNLILLSARDEEYAKSTFANSEDSSMKVYVSIAVGVVFFLVIIFLVVFLVMKKNKAHTNKGQRESMTTSSGEPELQHMRERTESPDLIPKSRSRPRDMKSNSPQPRARTNIQLSDQRFQESVDSEARAVRKESVV